MHAFSIGFHILAGSIALLAGAGALIYRKGGQDHARWGTWFFGAMLIMAASGAGLAASEGDPVTAIVGVFTLYLLSTSWSAARSRGGGVGWIEGAGLWVALGCALAQFSFGWQIAQSPTGRIGVYTPEVPYAFGVLASLAAMLDANALIQRMLSQRQRIARHLWRMCTALFLAASSLFLGQQDDVFFFMQGSPILWIPPLLSLLVMTYWLVRMRFGRGLASRRPAKMEATASMPR
jgi:hypothetical protein